MAVRLWPNNASLSKPLDSAAALQALLFIWRRKNIEGMYFKGAHPTSKVSETLFSALSNVRCNYFVSRINNLNFHLQKVSSFLPDFESRCQSQFGLNLSLCNTAGAVIAGFSVSMTADLCLDV